MAAEACLAWICGMACVALVGCAVGAGWGSREVGGAITEEANGDWASLRFGGKYRVMNNVWNKGAAQGAWAQKVFLATGADGRKTFGWQWDWPAGYQVVAYPEVVYGDKPWDEPAGIETEFPFKAGERRISVDFDVRVEATGAYNMAFTLWAMGDPADRRGSISHEVMIWTMNNGGMPAGTKRDVLKVGGVEFDVYVRENHEDASGSSAHTWTYVAFAARTPMTKGPLEISAFTDYLVGKGIMGRETYLASLEFGNEVINGTGRVEFGEYAVRVR